MQPGTEAHQATVLHEASQLVMLVVSDQSIMEEKVLPTILKGRASAPVGQVPKNIRAVACNGNRSKIKAQARAQQG